MFHKKLLTFIWSSEKSIYNIYDPQGSKLLNRLRFGFSHLPENKFRHNFADTVNPLCSCTLETESRDHYFLRCQISVSFRTALMNKLNSVNCGIVSLRPTALLEVILYGDKKLNNLTINQITEYLLRLSIALKTQNGLNRLYFEYLNITFSTS